MLFGSRRREAKYLSSGITSLRGLMTAYGFKYSSGTTATSSGGAFANGFFRRGTLEIGLVVRNGDELGCPNYTTGDGYAGHEDLIWALGSAGTEALVPAKPHAGVFVGPLSYVNREGGDAFAALGLDLERIILPSLGRSESEFYDSLARAVKKGQSEIGL